jgi:hypothetical protein
MPGSPQWSRSLGLTHQNQVHTSPLPPYAAHAQPISFFLILPPAQYWVRSTDIQELLVAANKLHLPTKYSPKQCLQKPLSVFSLSFHTKRLRIPINYSWRSTRQQNACYKQHVLRKVPVRRSQKVTIPLDLPQDARYLWHHSTITNMATERIPQAIFNKFNVQRICVKRRCQNNIKVV